jgi:predicted  nucleic acid-binding Zn-ribbon protein
MAGEAGVQGAEKELPNPPAPFERGQLVWAKLAGFPWWPSRVRRLEQVPAAGSGEVAGGAASWQARVRFCGTTFGDSRDFATIGCAGTMFSFQEKADEWAAKMPYAGKSKVIRKQWKKAVDEARASPAIDLSPDEEERAEAEAAAEHAAEAAAAAEAEAAVWAAGWSTSGHELVGARVARRFQGIEGNRPFLGTITRWLPPDAPAQDASIPAGGADGSKTNVGAPPERPSAEVSSTLAINGSTVVLMYKSTDGSVDASMETSVDTSAPPGADAASAGVGAAARGCAGVVPAVPAKVVGDDEVLFHVVMDDGDEEDLEQYEVGLKE